jgi:hypothetical protein
MVNWYYSKKRSSIKDLGNGSIWINLIGERGDIPLAPKELHGQWLLRKVRINILSKTRGNPKELHGQWLLRKVPL